MSELNEIRKDNATRTQRLVDRGVGLHPLQVLQARLDALTTVVLTDDEARDALDLDFEQRISEMLSLAEEQVNRSQLSLPGQRGFTDVPFPGMS